MVASDASGRYSQFCGNHDSNRQGWRILAKATAEDGTSRDGAQVISREYTVWCDYCSQWIQDGFVNNQKEFQQAMRKHGWSFNGRKAMCPECKEKGKRWEDSK